MLKLTCMISGVILSHNSKHSIKQAIDSLGFCEEIIVVDDNSDDNSVEIAKKAGVKVFSRSLNGDFSNQRNFALSQVTGQWIFYLDSDEEVSEELKNEIQSRCGREKGISAYKFNRSDILFGKQLKFGETARVRPVRLAKKDGNFWSGMVHEEWIVAGSVGFMNSPILHYPHKNVAQFLEKINSYSSYRAQELYNKNVSVSWWQIIIYPLAKFFTNYIIYQGFRDGTIGIIHALLMSFHSFLVRAKLWHLWDKKISKS